MVLKTEPGIEPFFLFPVQPRFLTGFPVVDWLLTGFGAFNRTGLASGWTGRTGRSGPVFKTVDIGDTLRDTTLFFLPKCSGLRLAVRGREDYNADVKAQSEGCCTNQWIRR